MFGAPPGALQGSWGDVRIQDATLAETAAVLLGRVDLQDLTGAGYPSRLADEVCAPRTPLRNQNKLWVTHTHTHTQSKW